MNPNLPQPIPALQPAAAAEPAGMPEASSEDQPSSLYRAGFWGWGVRVMRRLPHRFAFSMACFVARAYTLTRPGRRRIVERNLLPALGGDEVAARRAAAALFANFARKLVDLWSYEAGRPIQWMFRNWTGWEHFERLRGQGRGILLLTPHLGNWEFGAPLLADRGVRLLVVTLEEPHAPLTRMRLEARARWGIETLVIGSDPFAFVELIRRLEAGAVVAMLVDRPPPRGSVRVELFGRDFAASGAAAELSRASGCRLLPVFLPRDDAGYAAHILPELPYDRAALRLREERRRLTQQIMRAFEPAIRQHPDQWYHFVPIWQV